MVAVIKATVSAMVIAGIYSSSAALVKPHKTLSGVVPCTAFIDTTLVHVETERLEPHRTVITRGARIEAVLPSGQKLQAAGCARVDGQKKFLIPGLVDSHVHFFGYTRGGEGDAGAERDILLMLLSNGVTTAVAMEGSPELLKLRSQVRNGKSTRTSPVRRRTINSDDRIGCSTW